MKIFLQSMAFLALFQVGFQLGHPAFLFTAGDGNLLLEDECTSSSCKCRGFADIKFSFEEALVGGAAIDETGSPLPDKTLEICRGSDSVLLAAIGG